MDPLISVICDPTQGQSFKLIQITIRKSGKITVGIPQAGDQIVNAGSTSPTTAPKAPQPVSALDALRTPMNTGVPLAPLGSAMKSSGSGKVASLLNFGLEVRIGKLGTTSYTPGNPPPPALP